MSRILESLNDRQREAVQATEGYFRIIAGAGSGKTKTIWCRKSVFLPTESSVLPSPTRRQLKCVAE